MHQRPEPPAGACNALARVVDHDLRVVRCGRHVCAPTSPALANATDTVRDFLRAMAQDDGPSKMADVRARLNVSDNYASQYRLRLIAAESAA